MTTIAAPHLANLARSQRIAGEILARRIVPKPADPDLFVDLASEHEREKMKRRKRKRRWK